MAIIIAYKSLRKFNYTKFHGGNVQDDTWE